jgi:hypothetical protein
MYRQAERFRIRTLVTSQTCLDAREIPFRQFCRSSPEGGAPFNSPTTETQPGRPLAGPGDARRWMMLWLGRLQRRLTICRAGNLHSSIITITMVLLQTSEFLDNPFRTRQDTERALIACKSSVATFVRGTCSHTDLHLSVTSVLRPLGPHTSAKGALITFGSTGTHYDLRACQLEAFSRPLWGLVSLAIGGSSEGCSDLFDRWRSGLAAGTDPNGDEFWGWTKGKDQRMVEMSAIGFALASGQEQLFKVSEAKHHCSGAIFTCKPCMQPGVG